MVAWCLSIYSYQSKCHKCGFKTSNAVNAEAHFNETHGPKLKCPEPGCKFVFPDCHWRLFRTHYRTVHSNQELVNAAPVACDLQRKKRKTVKDANNNFTCGNENVKEWPVAGTFNPLGLDMTECIDNKPSGTLCSEWEKEPEGGFLEILDCPVEDESPYLQYSGPWKLISVDVEPPSQIILRNLPERQRLLDPRLD